MTIKEKIIFLYYDERMNNKTISIKLKVSTQYITKIIKKDQRYISEKERRKKESSLRKKQQNMECIKRKRQIARNERLDGYMELQHIQASSELSGKRTINNRAFKKWNSSIYDYHGRTNEFRLKNEFKNKTSYAVPKKIKWD